MFGHAPFLGQVRLVNHPAHVNLGQSQTGSVVKSKRLQCLEIGGAKLLECSNDPRSLQCRTLTATHDSCLAELEALEQQSAPIKPWTPSRNPLYPMRNAAIPEYANITPSTPGAQQAQGLSCPPGQYRAAGGWCVPIPMSQDIAPSKFSMSPFGSLFAGGGTTYGGS